MYINIHSYYSLRYGTLSPQKILQQSHQLGIKDIVLTDINNTSGCFELLKDAKKYDVHPKFGIDFRNENEQQFIGIAKNHDGFAQLNKFLSHHLNEKTNIPDTAPEFENSYIVYPFQANKEYNLKENEFIGVRKSDLSKLAFSPLKKYSDKLVALNSVTFTNKTEFNIHRILRAVDNNTIITKLQPEHIASPHEILKTYDQLQTDFDSFEYLLANTQKLIDNCSFDFDFKENKNKKYYTGNEKDDIDLLTNLTFEGVKKRYSKITKQIHDRINKELEIIIEKGFVSYFLINWDIIRFAKEKDFFCIGRGSGANSLIAYCLQITDVDPIDLDLYFERFINLFRETPPDFDLDFSWRDRDAVIDYIFKKHGQDHVALLATLSTFKERSFIREVAKTFGLPKQEIDALVGLYGEELVSVQTKTPDKLTQSIYKYGQLVKDFPNHLSIHAGGILISDKPIYYYTSTHLPPKGFSTSQIDMYVAEDISLFKFDILSQRGLGHIKEAVDLVKRNKNIDVDIHRINDFKNDPLLNKKLAEATAIGCFYIESPAMRGLMKKLQVDNYLTLVAASSIIRPGVARSGMMREFILRHRFPEQRKNIHKVMGEIMPDTYGVMVYQEDVIKVAHYFAKLTLGEADVLRRGMSGKYRSKEEFEKIKGKYFSNCNEVGHSEELTKDVWHQIESFAGYSFAKGHSASYAVESYQSLYLKTYYPLEFMVGVINNFGGFYSTELYIHEARMLGAKIESVCINNSLYETTIHGYVIYLGFIHVKSLEQKTVEHILDERIKNGLFESFNDFLNRVAISLEQIEILITLNAFRFSGITKQKLLIETYQRLNKTKKSNPLPQLFKNNQSLNYQFPELHTSEKEDMWDEMKILGYTLQSPFKLIDDTRINSIQCIYAKDIPAHKGEVINVIGYYVTVKPTSTIRGERMYFGTFIDEKGEWIDTIHFPPIAKKYPFRGKFCYLITGKVVEDFGVFSIEVSYMDRLKIWNSQTLNEAEKVLSTKELFRWENMLHPER
ncbi:MAG: DNA polymerase III subunit alpha [Fimbriimonadaceae bacterium]|nr:DNA polymerase III subunit alpha [Chitinophagales bacterium]